MSAAPPATEERRWLLELLDSADSPDDLQAIEDLLEAEERKQHSTRWECRTLAEVAEFFGLAVQTVKQWRTESPPMPGTEGRYPLQQIVAWRLAKLQSNSTSDAKKLAEVEAIRLVNERRTMENAHKRGLLIEREEIERDMSLLWSRLSARLQGIGERIAALVPAEMKATTKQRVEQEVRVIQKEFTDGLEELVSE
jgi:hypothetical protein